jgi:uncharacterized protein
MILLKTRVNHCDYPGGKRMKKAFYTLFTILIGILTLGLYFTQRLMYIRKKDEQLIIQREETAGRFNRKEWEQLPKEYVWIPSPHSYNIRAVVVRVHQTNRYIVFSHGVTENKMNSIKYMNIFLKRGFNAVIYDHRRHGETGGDTTSYGYYEKDDLKAVVEWLYKKVGSDLLVGIHGESMGAATALLYAADPDSLAHFYVVDCPFSDLRELLAYRIQQELKIIPPKWLLPIGNVLLKLRNGYRLEDVSPISVIEQINEPILFIHSEKDDYILPSMTKKLYEKKRGDKMMFIAKNGAHAQSYNENQKEYEDTIDEFLLTYVLKFQDH